MRSHAKIRQRTQKKGTSPFRASRVGDGNAESSNLWPLPTTMIKREHVTGCHRHVRQLNNQRNLPEKWNMYPMHLLSPNGKKTPKGNIFSHVIGFLYGVRGNQRRLDCWDVLHSAATSQSSQESRSSSNSRVVPSDPGTQLGTETVESMDWFKENLQETIDFPIQYGVFL